MSAPTPWQLVPPNRKPARDTPPRAPLEWYVRAGFCALWYLILFMLHHLHPSFEDAGWVIWSSGMAGYLSTQQLIVLYRAREKRILSWAAWTLLSCYSLFVMLSWKVHWSAGSWYLMPLPLMLVLGAIDAAAQRPRSTGPRQHGA